MSMLKMENGEYFIVSFFLQWMVLGISAIPDTYDSYLSWLVVRSVNHKVKLLSTNAGLLGINKMMVIVDCVSGYAIKTLMVRRGTIREDAQQIM